jgi:hypothetical protein
VSFGDQQPALTIVALLGLQEADAPTGNRGRSCTDDQ